MIIHDRSTNSLITSNLESLDFVESVFVGNTCHTITHSSCICVSVSSDVYQNLLVEPLFDSLKLVVFLINVIKFTFVSSHFFLD